MFCKLNEMNVRYTGVAIGKYSLAAAGIAPIYFSEE